MKHLLLIFLLFCGTLVMAQPSQSRALNLPSFDAKRLYFGFYIGFNVMDFHVTHKNPSDLQGEEPRYAEVTSLTPGINLGMVSNLRLNNRFNLRVLPGISFGQRDLLFVNADGVKDDRALDVKSTYIEFPILLKYSGNRITNARPFVIGGVNPRFDLAKSKKDGIYLNSFDAYLELGAGIDSYLTFFRFTTELKLSVGMLNILNPAGTGEPEDIRFTHMMDKITSRIFVLTFYFEG